MGRSSASLGAALHSGARLARALSPAPSVDRSAYYRAGWLGAAEQLGLPHEDLGGGFLRIGRPSRELIVHGPELGLDTVATYFLAGDKAVSGGLLRSAGLPVPDGDVYGLGESDLIRRLRRDGATMVVKPAADTGGGRGVTVGPANGRLVVAAVVEAGAFGTRIVCEPRLCGQVVRGLVLDGVLLDSVVRVPASVVGDGRHTVAQLVAAENHRRRRLGSRATGFIPTGADFRSALARAGLAPSSRPPVGVPVAVAGRSNTGSELESRRIAVGPDVADAAVRAAKVLGVRLGGVDLALDDHGRLIGVLEVNTVPELSWHQLVASEPYDVFSAVLAGVCG